MKSKIALIPLIVAVVVLSYIVLVPEAPQEQLVGTPAEIAESIVWQYHETHIYSEYDLFVCSDMALDVWNMLKAQGINALIQIGNVEEEVQDISEANHAWVLAEVSPDKYLALETTSGCAVWDNPLYYEGWSFHNPRSYKRFLELKREYNLRVDLVERYAAANALFIDTYLGLASEYEQSYNRLAGTPCTDPSFGHRLAEAIEMGMEVGTCAGKSQQLSELIDEELRRLENIVHEMKGLCG
jgi:hypothetical protein